MRVVADPEGRPLVGLQEQPGVGADVVPDEARVQLVQAFRVAPGDGLKASGVHRTRVATYGLSSPPNSRQFLQQMMQEHDIIALHVIHLATHTREAFAETQVINTTVRVGVNSVTNIHNYIVP